MAEKFDLVAIGTGSGASAVAQRCRSAGWKVAILDSRPFGGTCALRGCDPKKVLVGAADAIDWIRRMEGKGVRGEARIEWPELMSFKRSLIEGVPKNREEGLARAGIAVFHGRARFVGPTSVQVGETVLEGRYVVVAAGMRPADLKIVGAEHLTTSDQFLELDHLPGRIAFVGGGYISFEFAHVAVRAGAEVTILHRGERPLPRFDPDLVDLLVERTRTLGVRVELQTAVSGIERTADGLAVHASTAGEDRLLHGDLVVHGAGRVPEVDDMDLAAAGVEWDERGVKVNEYLQSVSNPAVYAAGDAAASGGPPLTPVAGYEGRIVAANLLNGNTSTADYKAIPSVAFTVPPLAAVGLQEATARQQGLHFRVHRERTSGWYSSRRIAEEYSAFKVLIEEGTERILGAHLLGPHAEDTVNLFALAIRSELGVRELKQTIFAYPTHASDVAYML
jgi:glutathione reductase (NADPH)